MTSYPKMYVGRYPVLARWLVSMGHIVYPMEMYCKPVWIAGHFLYGNVDVVSRYKGVLYAWEFKSWHDQVRRAIPQLRNYARGFDRVCLAVARAEQVTRYFKTPEKYAPRAMNIYDAMREIGAGIYLAQPSGSFLQVLKSQPQRPDPEQRDKLAARFEKYAVKHPPVAFDLRQTTFPLQEEKTE